MNERADGTAPPMSIPPNQPSKATHRLPLDRVVLAGSDPEVRPRATLDRDQILDATQACLAEHGYDGTTIRRIAGALGCAVGSIYRYFKDKRELLIALGDREFHAVEQAMARGATLDESIGMYRRTADANAVLYRLMFWLSAVSMGTDRLPVPRSVEAILDRWAEAIGSRDRAERVWAQLHGSVMLGKPLPGASQEAPATTLGGPARRLPAIRVGQVEAATHKVPA